MINMVGAEKLTLVKDVSVILLLTAVVLALFIPNDYRTFPLVLSLPYLYLKRKEVHANKYIKVWFLVFLLFVLFFALSAENMASARKGLYDILRGCFYFFPGYFLGKRLEVHAQYLWFLVIMVLSLSGSFLVFHEHSEFYGDHANANSSAFGVVLVSTFILPVLFLKRKKQQIFW